MTNSLLPQLQPSGIPLYLQVKQAVLGALAAGEWTQGDAIPPEKALAERFGVSIGTLRKAIDELAAENILVRHQGRGTFVAMHARNQHFFRFFRIVRHDGVKAYPTTELLRFRRGRPNKEVQEKLLLGPDSVVFEFVNALSLHGRRNLVDVITIPENLFSGLTRQQLAARPSTLYNFYQEAFGINVIGTSENLRAAKANPEQAEILGVALDAPLLQVRRVAYSFNRQPVEWRLSHVNTESYEYQALEHEG